MSVHDVLMASGDWTVRLTDACPVSIRRQLDKFGHIVITKARGDTRRLLDEHLLPLASYVGVVRRRRNNRCELSGPGLAFWLGDESGKGAIFESVVEFTGGSLTDWINAILPVAVAAGTITDPGGTLTWSTRWVTPRVALDYVCASFGVEWRIRLTATGPVLDVGTAVALFVDEPTVIAVKKGGGADLTIRGLDVVELQVEDDAEDYTTRALLLAQGEGDSITVGAADISPATSYKDLRGNAMVMKRMVSSPETPAGNESDVAAQQLALYTSERRAVTLSVDAYDIEGHAKPGDWIRVFDPQNDIYDLTGQVPYRGHRIHAAKIRVIGYTFPTKRGMGVYYRKSNGVYIDLSPYMAWEEGATSFEVGAVPRIGETPPTPIVRPAAAQVATERRAAQGQQTKRVAVASFPTGTTTATVTWDEPFADTNYTVALAFYDDAGLADAGPITDLQADHIDVLITNTAGYDNGGTLHAIAIHD